MTGMVPREVRQRWAVARRLRRARRVLARVWKDDGYGSYTRADLPPGIERHISDTMARLEADAIILMWPTEEGE